MIDASVNKPKRARAKKTVNVAEIIEPPEPSEILVSAISSEAVVLPKYVIQKKLPRHINKPNSIVHNKPHTVLTVTQQKFINVLLLNVMNNYEAVDPQGYCFMKIKDFVELLNLKTKNWEYLDKTIKQMINIKAIFEGLEDKLLVRDYITVFPHVRLLENGFVKYQTHSEILKLLDSNKDYTRIALADIVPLSKVCAIPLFELCRRYQKIGHTAWMPWEEVRNHILSSYVIPKNAETFTKFNKFYLTPAIEDINANTDLIVELEKDTQGKSVKALRFRMYQAQSMLKSSVITENLHTKSSLVQELTELGVSPRAASTLFKTFTKEELNAGIAHLRWRLQQTQLKTIKYPTRFLKESIEHKYYLSYMERGVIAEPSLFDREDLSAESTQKPATVKVASKAQESLDKGKAKLVKGVERMRLIRVKQILAEMNEPEIEELYAEYNSQTSIKGLKIFNTLHNKHGVLNKFHNWYCYKLWGEITQAEILDTIANLAATKDLF